MKQKNLNSDLEKKLNRWIKGYAYLFLSMAIVIIFVFVLAPTIDDVPQIKPIINFIDERGLDAGALYYTDIEEFSVAELNMNNTLIYSPVFKIEEKLLKIENNSANK